MPKISIGLVCRRTVLGWLAIALLVPLHVAAAPAIRTVTLVTGDRVSVDSNGNTSILAAKGRAHVSFRTLRAAGHLHVIPSDAVALLRAGRLDARLFDVTRLLEYGYDKRASTPVIVTGAAAASALTSPGSASARPSASTALLGRELKAVHGVALQARGDGALWRSLTASSANAIAIADSGKVWLDGLRKLSLDQSVPQIGGDVAHKLGFDGKGVKVAIVDSGIDVTHPDLKDQVAAHKNFVSEEEDDRDFVGHGTHVASTVAGTGAASGGKYAGVAPGAKLLDAKACYLGGCPESALLEALQWAVDSGAKIINLSLGGEDTPELDPIEEAVNTLSAEHGALVVASSGNDAVFGFPVASPASADAALAVGAVDKQDVWADFSQEGPRVGDAALKPDLVAPGVDITAAKSSNMGEGTPGGDRYLTASGTSMSAPHVSGAAAILAQRYPDWKGAQLKAALMNSAKFLAALTPLAQGAGRVDIPAALSLQLGAEPVSVSFGRQAWPHDDDECVTRTVTITNQSAAPATVQLALETTGPDGAPTAPGVFTLSTDCLNLAPHEQGSVTITADTRLGSDGFLGGQLIATSETGRAHVPFFVEREVESYELVLKHLDRAGQPTAQAFTDVFPYSLGNQPPNFLAPDEEGLAKLRLPKGDYVINCTIFPLDVEDGSVTYAVDPKLQLTADQTVVIDARLAKPIAIEPPLSDATPYASSISILTEVLGSGASASGPAGVLYTLRLGTTAAEGLSATIVNTWLRGEDPAASSYQIHAAYFVRGDIPTGFTRVTDLSEFAQVRTRFAKQGSLTDSFFSALGTPADETEYSSSAVGVNLALPQAFDIYYSEESGQRWELSLAQIGLEDFVFDIYSGTETYAAGQSYDSQWNMAVFGPSTSDMFGPSPSLRYENTLQIFPTLIADADGHAGSVGFTSARTALYADGSLVSEEASPGGVFDVAPERARYRVEIEAQRTPDAELSSEVALAWEFESEVAGPEGVVLPLSLIHFKPALSQLNAAPGNQVLAVPVQIEAQTDSDARPIESLLVEVSFDDGATWTPAPLSREGAGWIAEVTHPLQSGYVSLRAKAVDADNNSVEQAFIRAYRLE